GTNNNNTKVGLINDDTENIDWEATLNPLGLTINDAIITDMLNEHQTYVLDAEGKQNIVVKNSDNETVLVEGEDKDYTLEITNENRTFTVTFNGPIDYAVEVSYSTRLNPELIGFYEA